MRRIDMQLSSTFEELERAVKELQSAIGDLEEDLGHRIVLLASEAITNAMEHGNNWQPERKARLSLVVSEHEVELEVADEGQGIRVPRKEADPLRSKNRLKDHGRGLMLMREYADEVHVADGARTLRLVFFRKSGPDG
ncbi:MAG: ATP-binding protein [Bacteroidota bacterium]|nr:ATP-binding protein [Bacteroidota bacterium]MDE2834558.1 ATP-binding protein [Bacteroidota bacterium]